MKPKIERPNIKNFLASFSRKCHPHKSRKIYTRKIKHKARFLEEVCQ